jgi:hypothetical protein
MDFWTEPGEVTSHKGGLSACYTGLSAVHSDERYMFQQKLDKSKVKEADCPLNTTGLSASIFGEILSNWTDSGQQGCTSEFSDADRPRHGPGPSAGGILGLTQKHFCSGGLSAPQLRTVRGCSTDCPRPSSPASA